MGGTPFGFVPRSKCTQLQQRLPCTVCLLTQVAPVRFAIGWGIGTIECGASEMRSVVAHACTQASTGAPTKAPGWLFLRSNRDDTQSHEQQQLLHQEEPDSTLWLLSLDQNVALQHKHEPVRFPTHRGDPLLQKQLHP